jgi:hypothetical protein
MIKLVDGSGCTRWPCNAGRHGEAGGLALPARPLGVSAGMANHSIEEPGISEV